MNDEHDADPDDVTSDPESTQSRTRASAHCSPSSGPAPTANRSLPRSRPGSTTRSPCSLPSAVAPPRGPGEDEVDDRARRPATSYPCADAGCRAPGRQPPRSSCWASAAWPWPTSAVCPSRSSRAPRTAPVRRRPRRSPGLSPRLSPRQAGSDSSTGATQLPDLSAASFESDVSILLQGRASMLASEGEAAGEGEAADEPSPTSRENALPGAPGVLPSRACPGPEVTDGAAARQVLYDGRQAVLLVHPERGGRLLVEAWNCDGDRRLASTKIKP